MTTIKADGYGGFRYVIDGVESYERYYSSTLARLMAARTQKTIEHGDKTYLVAIPDPQ